ncbi:MAG TPA: methyltransferase domain-containing protein [Solirubrobacteraceae bacterium]|nr:methyltransferase domain-containing protein [Solirubrobacteraceae bacterium]
MSASVPTGCTAGTYSGSVRRGGAIIPVVIRRARYPLRFVATHPVRAARNAVGNHPSQFADRYLRGLRGVEIGGAAHNSFFLETVNVDLSQTPSTSDAQLTYAGHRMPIDFVAPADDLPFPDRSHDFVLSSHVLEHLPDPIGTLYEWLRVASRYVFVILPQPDNEFDDGRDLAGIDELLYRHRSGLFTSPDWDQWGDHWSSWTSSSFVALCEYLRLEVLDVQDPDDKRGNGFAIVINADRGRASRLRSGET